MHIKTWVSFWFMNTRSCNQLGIFIQHKSFKNNRASKVCQIALINQFTKCALKAR